ncbi:MAG: phosphate ABC transporter substrate-binding protein [Oscillospiraceae bacterium]|nr:phosphate ABC transporter substrate-binding protein [Oscillospiraceae bacterium]
MKIKKTAVKAAVLVLTVLVVISPASCGRAGAGVIIAGSTSVQPYAEILVEEYMIMYREGAIDVQGGGSSAGITAAGAGTADIGMSSRGLNKTEVELWHTEIARDGLAVIVHPDNPIVDLSLEQIRAIYSGALTNWEQFGGNSAAVHVIAREEGSGTRTAFEELVMDGAFVSKKAIIQDSNGSVRQLVSGDKNSIGFISLGLVTEAVKALKLGGVEATSENVTNGTYALYRPFIFVCAGEPEGAVRQFIDFTVSPNGQRILKNEGLVTFAADTEQNGERTEK